MRQAMLEALGARVRSLREGQGMPRRALADVSGVSSRFLAQLESGEGNISVARLADVALALGATPSALLAASEDGALEPGPQAGAMSARIQALLERRSEGELREVLAWLEARFHPAPGPTVALLGVRGAGKSTVGRRLADRLELPFHELDQLIEEAAGLTLNEIFELHGEAYYRRLERETLLHYLATHPMGVLATGGSLVTDRESFRLLRRRALTVWLKARPEDHWNRVIQQGDQRPMARNPHAMQELRALLTAREKLYAEAEYTVDTSTAPIDEIVEQLAVMVQRSA
jgi:XRE family aerobic/anaerobic benzoate catabolism transcriptional regulator